VPTIRSAQRQKYKKTMQINHNKMIKNEVKYDKEKQYECTGGKTITLKKHTCT
jgi:hypothetical protein